jgi:hypothetical protein
LPDPTIRPRMTGAIRYGCIANSLAEPRSFHETWSGRVPRRWGQRRRIVAHSVAGS